MHPALWLVNSRGRISNACENQLLQDTHFKLKRHGASQCLQLRIIISPTFEGPSNLLKPFIFRLSKLVIGTRRLFCYTTNAAVIVPCVFEKSFFSRCEVRNNPTPLLQDCQSCRCPFIDTLRHRSRLRLFWIWGPIQSNLVYILLSGSASILVRENIRHNSRRSFTCNHAQLEFLNRRHKRS